MAILVTITVLLAGGFAGAVPMLPGVGESGAAGTSLLMPFPAGQSWIVGQGYNTRPPDAGSHYDCNPTTLKDSPTGTETCNSYYRYRFAMDLARADGNTAGQPALAPAAGTITWTEAATGGGVLNLGDGYAFAFFHLVLDPAIKPGATVVAGQRLGTVAPAGQANNDGWPHLHVNLWQSSDGGNWDRNSVPFTGIHALGGYSFADQGTTAYNQWRGTGLTSSTVDRGGSTGVGGSTTPPATPVQQSPANSSVVTRANPQVLMTWLASSGATSYQVYMDNGQIVSPWVTGTSWTTPVLSAGQHVWQVKARNANGESPLSVKWIVYVNTSGVPSSSPSPSPSSSAGSGSSGITLSPAAGSTATAVTLSGGGFSGGEQVSIYLDSTGTAPLATTTATSGGGISTSLTIGEATRGSHVVIANGATSHRSYTTTYNVSPSLTRTPVSGTAGTPVTVSVHGFGPGENVQLNWDSESGPDLGTARTDANGFGSVSFRLPVASAGWHDYVGVGSTSGARAYGAFQILSSLTLSTPSAAPGDGVTATANGYTSGQAVTFRWNSSPSSAGTLLCTVTASSTGTASCPFTVPPGSGVFPITAVSGSITNSATLSVGGGLSVMVQPTSGVVGSSIQITGGGFSPGEGVSLSWDAGTTSAIATADRNGAFSQSVTIPYLGYGSHKLTARGQVSRRSTTATYTVGETMSITPTTGVAGTTVTISMQGMPAGRPATVRWDGASGSTLCTGTVDARGSYGCTFQVPSGTANRAYSVVVASDGVSSTASFSMLATSNATPVGGNQVGTGTYVVNATREGLVGGMTASGYYIQPYDRFISLPACTTTSCPWLTPGVNNPQWGIRTECGNSCYVRVVNPNNDRCIVAPVKDVGPWFTLDDYWNATGDRYLNNLDSNPNILRQGFPGSQAARNGLDVGYGVAPSGIGISNKGYEVGNSSGIDIGDGSWVDLGYNIQGASAGSVTVSMLWQTGEDPDAAARACGQTSANPPPGDGSATATPTPTAGVPARGTSTPTAAVPPRGTSTPTVTPTAPTRGTSTPTAVGRGTSTPTSEARPTSTPVLTTPDANRPTATPRPLRGTSTPTATARPGRATSTPTRTPNGLASGGLTAAGTGSAGASVDITFSGFDPGERVDARWDSPNADVAESFRADSAGNGVGALRVPNLPAGEHTVYLTGSHSGFQTSLVVTVAGEEPAGHASAGSTGAGAAASVDASGLSPGYGVDVHWGDAGGEVVCRGVVRQDGTFACQFVVESDVVDGDTQTLTVVSGDTVLSVPVAFDTLGDGSQDATGGPTATPRRQAPASTPTVVASTATAITEAAPARDLSDEPPATDIATERPGATDQPSATVIPTEAAPTMVPTEAAPTVVPTETPLPARATATATATEVVEAPPTEVLTETPTETSTDVPTEIPTATPTETPTDVPTQEPVIETFSLYPIAETTVEPPADVGTPAAYDPTSLTFGGPEGAITYLTYDVSAYAAPGTVVSATLTVTGHGGSGQAGQILAFPDMVIDPAVTWDTRPIGAVEATDSDGAPAWLGWIDPGVTVSVDVTGTVSSSGTVTFVLIGSPDASLSIGGSQSDNPPVLTIETATDPASAG